VARPDLAADRARAFALVPVSRETTARLDRFTALLLDWQSRINLIAASTVPVLWTRHIADSLQLLAIAPDARKWVDLGSGGGFPGVPIACALAEQGSAEVHLIESNKKKAAFLREAVRITGAPAIVHAVRIADFCQSFRGALDAVTARALAPLPELLSIAYPLLKKGRQGVFPKGQDVEAELTEAAKCWSIQASLVPSRTDPESRVVLIRRAEPRRKQ
jgi:16S rRNA (guanine527-N7)-methyltransferase